MASCETAPTVMSNAVLVVETKPAPDAIRV
jgi:hypothetical protein